MPDSGKTLPLRGLLIRKTEFGEGHCAYTALSAEQGRIDFLTFGSRRENSSRRASLLVANLVNALLARRSEESEWTLREIAVEKCWPGLFQALDRAAFCHLTLEILDRIVARGNPFSLFERVPPLLDRLESDPEPGKFALAFLIVLLREDGLLPEPRSPEADFGHYPGLFPPEYRLGDGSRRFIADALTGEASFPEGRTVSRSVTGNLLEFIRHLVRYHTGRDLQSLTLFPGR